MATKKYMTFLVLRKALSTRNTSSRTTKSPTHQMGARPPKKKNHRHSSKFCTSACIEARKDLYVQVLMALYWTADCPSYTPPHLKP